jgi:DNA-binding LacI/PurR family transcriptional regulator/DNA-binding transcriptional regulator YhcF (GntR family)
MKLKYAEIKKWLKKESLKPESSIRMPTVRELMRSFNVSLATVNRALQDLEQDGLISRRHGSGIVAGDPNGKLKHATNLKAAGDIIFAYINYPAERLWQMEHVFDQNSRQKNFNLICYPAGKSDCFATLPEYTRHCQNLKGIILYSTAERLSDDVIKQLAAIDIPVVLMDNDFDYELPANYFSLSPDMIDRGRSVVEYLLKHGHRKIAIIRNEPLVDNYNHFKQGIFSAFKRWSDLDFKPLFLSQTINSWNNAADAAQSITLKNLERIQSEKITALVYYSTYGAFAAIQTLTENGVKVPDDISVISAPDYYFAKYTSPALTVSSCDYLQMAIDAFDLVTGVQPIIPGKNKLYPHTIIERKSVINV